MVVIRLARGGDKKSPFYRIVVTDRRNRRDGRFIEQLGYYDPMARGQATPIKLDLERVKHWNGVGARMSDRVKQLVNAVQKDKAPQAQERMTVQKMSQSTASLKKQELAAKAEKKAAQEAAAAAENTEKAESGTTSTEDTTTE